MTVTKKNSSPGRARHKPSTHCAGKAGCSPLDLYAHVRLFYTIAHETAGAARTRSSLRPLISRARNLVANLGRTAPRECGGASRPDTVIPGRCEASNPESRDSGSGPSDHPGMTGLPRRPLRFRPAAAMESPCLRGAPSALAARLPPEFRLSARPGPT